MSARIIGIAGPSGSGKSELSRRLSAATGASIVSLDSYYRDLGHLTLAERDRTNFDEPGSMDDALLLEQCMALSDGRPVDVPHYDFSCHTRVAGTQRIEAGKTVIVEGLFTLYWNDLRHLLHASVYVDLEDEVCYARRLARDVRERGRTPESVELQYLSTVRPMAERYIWPTRRHADIVVRGDALLEESVATVLRFVDGRPLTSPAASGSASP
ncbi:MAG: uridine kinase [Acidobacteria bacterium]|nr:uridine kinase [Acidobacteriota bacterium]